MATWAFAHKGLLQKTWIVSVNFKFAVILAINTWCIFCLAGKSRFTTVAMTPIIQAPTLSAGNLPVYKRLFEFQVLHSLAKWTIHFNITVAGLR